MFDHSRALINEVMVCRVGSLHLGEGIEAATQPWAPADPLLHDLLLKFFLSNVKDEVEYSFVEGSQAQEVVKTIFENPTHLADGAISLAEMLYEKSTHPKVKGGDFFVVSFENVVMGDELVNAIGVFKAESAESLIDVRLNEGKPELGMKTGYLPGKMDKACLIMDTEPEHGYKALVHDAHGNREANFWLNDFLQLKARPNDFYSTKKVLEVVKEFTKNMPLENPEEAKKEKAGFMEKSVAFFEERDAFDMKEFEQEVLKEPEVIEAFQEHRRQVAEKKGVEVEEAFAISDKAVTNARKRVRSVIKLDNNFHVYVHANPDNLEKGFDPVKGMNYYTLYYKEES